MSDIDLYLAVLSAAADIDVDAVHAAFWRRDTDYAALFMLAARYGIETSETVTV